MATLRNMRDIPPGGWHYVERATGVRFEADSFDDLVRKVKSHREYKGIDVATTGIDVQRQLCLGLTDAECTPEPGETYRPVKDLTQSLSTDLAVSANRALLQFVKGGMQFVDPAVAESRAAICRTCPFNKPAKNCSCHAIYRMIQLLIPSSRQKEGISVCMACGCSLQAKVNMPQEVIDASNAPETVFPDWCWQAAKSAEPVEPSPNP